MEENKKILLCEDDENLGMLLREYLQAKDYDTTLCPDGEEGYRAFLTEKYDLCVLAGDRVVVNDQDVHITGPDGFHIPGFL